MYTSELIVSEISEILRNDTELKSAEIIVQQNITEKSPVFHIEHNLGIESWCTKDLYLYAHRTLFTKTLASLDELALLTAALLLNPNVKTFWNRRRKLVQSSHSNLGTELRFVTVVLSLKPKAQDAFNYRKWLLGNAFTENANTSFLFEELKVIISTAERFTNNHMVWDYGIWLLNSFPALVPSVLVPYWKIVDKWINVNVSDYSAIAFRQHLLRKLATDCADSEFRNSTILSGLDCLSCLFNDTSYREFEICDSFYAVALILEDFGLNEKLILFYQNHEALWNHRRFLCYYFRIVLPSKVSDRLIFQLRERLQCPLEGDLFYTLFLHIHQNFISKFKAGDDLYVEKYVNWLNKFKIL